MHPRPVTINTLLRNSVRRPARSGRLALPFQFVRKQTGPGISDDFGGPGNQEFPPKSSSSGGSNEPTKRNWPMITGVAFVAVAAFAYFGGGGPAARSDMKMDPTVRKGEDGLRKLEEQASRAVGELSGKKSSSSMGAFRAD